MGIRPVAEMITHCEINICSIRCWRNGVGTWKIATVHKNTPHFITAYKIYGGNYRRVINLRSNTKKYLVPNSGPGPQGQWSWSSRPASSCSLTPSHPNTMHFCALDEKILCLWAYEGVAWEWGRQEPKCRAVFVFHLMILSRFRCDRRASSLQSLFARLTLW